MPNQQKRRIILAEAALLAAALFWGLALIFQRKALDHMSPMAYQGLRITVGALPLLPIAIRRLKRRLAASPEPRRELRRTVFASCVAGAIMCLGSGLQQYALQWTTVAKVGFITCLYVVLVPILLFLAGRKIGLGEALGAVLALAGLFLLSVTATLSLSAGDTLVIIGAFVWAGHVIFLGVFSPRMDPFVFSAGMALAAGIIGLCGMVALGETPGIETFRAAWPIIFFGGMLSVTLGYTLQIAGQSVASETVTAIILQLEAVFAAVAGWLILGEGMTGRMIAGAAVMFLGVTLVQLWPAPNSLNNDN